ncbi:hypothetical protein SE17_33180 [Kouleothrix aurantiaca]|uniref:Uncharacterized protein n=1 Tax=Kouleothrix aurantiaca TaxID=186479 RepID=A0A0P9DHF1_9CHLR|nr:hypothetical protein SE17_33180 [Kouleothrix aurantiaca]
MMLAAGMARTKIWQAPNKQRRHGVAGMAAQARRIFPYFILSALKCVPPFIEYNAPQAAQRCLAKAQTHAQTERAPTALKRKNIA